MTAAAINRQAATETKVTSKALVPVVSSKADKRLKAKKIQPKMGKISVRDVPKMGRRVHTYLYTISWAKCWRSWISITTIFKC